MKKIVFLLLLITGIFSCNNDDDEIIKTQIGDVWLSGGLNNCAQQIRLDSGDTLVVNLNDIASYVSGDRVNVKYKEIGENEFCSPKLDVVVIDISKID